MDINLIIVAVYSYFLGSIPFGLVLTKIFLKKDIRNIGSGNIGTTNVLRTGKKSLASPCLTGQGREAAARARSGRVVQSSAHFTP